MIPAPFYSIEQRPLSVTASSGSVTFTSLNQAEWPHVRIVNYGGAGCQVNLYSGTAVNTASAGGTTQHYIGVGEDVIFSRCANNAGTLSAIMSAICDGSGSTSIIFELGSGF